MSILGLLTCLRGKPETWSGAESDGERMKADGGINSRDEGVVVEVNSLLDVAGLADDDEAQRAAARPPQQYQSSPIPLLHAAPTISHAKHVQPPPRLRTAYT